MYNLYIRTRKYPMKNKVQVIENRDLSIAVHPSPPLFAAAAYPAQAAN